jgi:hypothetical protein
MSVPTQPKPSTSVEVEKKGNSDGGEIAEVETREEEEVANIAVAPASPTVEDNDDKEEEMPEEAEGVDVQNLLVDEAEHAEFIAACDAAVGG